MSTNDEILSRRDSVTIVEEVSPSEPMASQNTCGVIIPQKKKGVRFSMAPQKEDEEDNEEPEELDKRLEQVLQEAEEHVVEAIKEQQEEMENVIDSLNRVHDHVVVERMRSEPYSLQKLVDKLHEWSKRGVQMVFQTGKEAQEVQLAYTLKMMAALDASHKLQLEAVQSDAANATKRMMHLIGQSARRPQAKVLQMNASGAMDATRKKNKVVLPQDVLKTSSLKSLDRAEAAIWIRGRSRVEDDEGSDPDFVQVGSRKLPALSKRLGRARPKPLTRKSFFEGGEFWGDRATDKRRGSTPNLSDGSYSSSAASGDSHSSHDPEEMSQYGRAVEREIELIDEFINPQTYGPPTTIVELVDFQSWKIRDLGKQLVVLQESNEIFQKANADLQNSNAVLQARLEGAGIAVPPGPAFLEGYKSPLWHVKTWLQGVLKAQGMDMSPISTPQGMTPGSAQITRLVEKLQLAIASEASMPASASAWEHNREPQSADVSQTTVKFAPLLKTILQVPLGQEGSRRATPRVVGSHPPIENSHPYPMLGRYNLPEDCRFVTLEIAVKLLFNVFIAACEVCVHGLWWVGYVGVEFIQLLRVASLYTYPGKSSVQPPRLAGIPTMPGRSLITLIESFLLVVAIQAIVANARERRIWLQANGLTREYMLQSYRDPTNWMGIPKVDGDLTWGFGDVWDTIKWGWSSLMYMVGYGCCYVILYVVILVDYVQSLWD